MDESQPPIVIGSPKQRKLGSVLLVILLLIATAAGVWFWQQREINDLQRSQNVTPVPIGQTNTETSNTDGVDNWSVLSLGPTFLGDNKSAQLSFKLPPRWLAVNCGGGEDALVTYLSSTEETQAICGTEQVSPITLSAQTGNVTDSYIYNEAPTYKSAESKDITIDGKKFKLNSGVVDKPLEFGPPTGSTLTSYVYHDRTTDITYSTTYVRTPEDEPNLSADFKKIIEETLSVADITPAD